MMTDDTKRLLKIGIIGAAAVAACAAVWWSATGAQAADLGGGCCSDLEERIAELEATTARKGNRKVSLTVSGQINAALLYVDVEDYSNTTVQQNGTDESFIGFSGAARVGNGVTAGYVLEIDLHQLGLLGAPVESTEPGVRQSFVYLKSENLGKLSIGRQGTATQDFDKITTANTTSVTKPLSLGAISDAYLTGIDVPFDGIYRDAVRYDSPSLAGFTLSAAWGNSFDGTKPDGDGDMWDVALRYTGDAVPGFKVTGGVGYRSDTDLEINALNLLTISLPTGDVKTILASGSVMHATSGLFLTANYAGQDWQDANFKLTGWQATGGIEQRFFAVGKTMIYAEYGVITFKPDGDPDADIDLWGIGIVQNLEGAAMDLYAGYRNYDLGDFGGDDIKTGTLGARIKF